MSDNERIWVNHIKQIFKNKTDREKKTNKGHSEADVEPPAHLRNSINAMYAIFLSLMEISKKKYSEHVRKMICFNIVFLFQKFVETQKIFGQLLKEENDVIEMDDLISVTNQLRDLLGGLENKQLVLSLPLIVVVGDEASGKSSVIEAIVGREFLPRGPGIVSRCPLIVQLTNREGQEFWNFDHIPGKVFNDTKAVRAEIQRKTSEVAVVPKG
ncbi:Dynamin-A [Halotydeus destructor]|nr:Dynamin-A [Halotydeus destructor]